MIELAPDPALPQRDLLLDGAAMAPRIAARMGAGVERCEPVRARYNPGHSLRVLYRVHTGGVAHLVALRTFPGARSAEVYERALATARPSGPLQGVAHAGELRAVLFAFPNDRKVAGLHALSGQLVAWAPEKCATVRRRRAYAKAYAGDDGERTLATHRALWEPALAAGLRLPRATGYSQADRTLECEPIDGTPLARLAGAERRAGLHGLGAALARLHRLDPPAGAVRLDRTRLDDAARAIATVRPDCAGAATELAELLRGREPPEMPAVCLHGDVHPKNAIVTDGGVALIDLDQVAVGPAAADVGSMLAALRYARAERADADAFLAGYASVAPPPDRQALRWHVAAALLAERALRSVTRVRRDGLANLPRLLADAREAIA